MKIKQLRLSLGQFLCFLLCLMLMMVIPIAHDHKLFGADISTPDEESAEVPTLTAGADGTYTINTTELGKDIIGYRGPTPVEITVKDGMVTKVKALPNQETPEFFGAVRNSDILESFNGLTLEEASQKHIDAVSGATFTSEAVIANMKAGVDYTLHEDVASIAPRDNIKLDFKWYFTLAVVLAGSIIPLFFRNKRYRLLQLLLNVGILGFWGGTFISYSLMVSYLTNGITQVVLIPAALLLISAFIYPMFGKADHYCLWLCPYGSIQELAAKCVKRKIQVPPRVSRWLGNFRRLLWFVLMWLLWTGLWFDWMGYEPFAAFFFRDASPVVLGIAGGFLLLSFFISRPYCRFVCPTGSLFKFSEGELRPKS